MYWDAVEDLKTRPSKFETIFTDLMKVVKGHFISYLT